MKAWVLRWLFLGGVLALGCASSPAPPPPPTVSLCGGEATSPVEKLRSEGNTQTVRASATVMASEDEAPSRARQRAETKALAKAVEFVAGVRVKSGFLSFEQMGGADSWMLIQRLNATWVDALVIGKEIVKEEAPAGDLSRRGYCYGVVVDATVLDRRQSTDPGFEVHLSLNRDRIVSGDSVQVRVESSRDARIYLIGISDHATAVILPNQERKDTWVKAGETLVFPDITRGDEALLQAEIPEGQAQATELLLAIALRGGAELKPTRARRKGEFFETMEAKGAGSLLENYLSPLMRLPADQWAFAQIAYEIRR
jgi:hypothetical protein